MAKLAIVLASLLFLALAVAISAYTTTVTTVEIDEEKPSWSWSRGQRACSQKLQRANLRPCERYIKNQCRRGEGGQQQEEEEEEGIALRGVRIWGNENLEECCNQLKELNNRSCKCRALKKIMLRQSSELEGSQMQQFQHQLQKLPQKCNFQLPQCELGRIEIEI